MYGRNNSLPHEFMFVIYDVIYISLNITYFPVGLFVPRKFLSALSLTLFPGILSETVQCCPLNCYPKRYNVPFHAYSAHKLLMLEARSMHGITPPQVYLLCNESPRSEWLKRAHFGSVPCLMKNTPETWLVNTVDQSSQHSRHGMFICIETTRISYEWTKTIGLRKAYQFLQFNWFTQNFVIFFLWIDVKCLMSWATHLNALNAGRS